ncbi:MAG TPA: type II secretion system protein [Thermoanaerobaculia bacterium]|nr:type II secretion system protein [Thermoanaerobaculia bacterium]
MRAGKTKHDSKQSGFTLIELLIVVSLIAILAAIIVPNARRAKHKTTVAAAQSAAHCLETWLSSSDPLSSDPVEQYPQGIGSQQDLITAGNQLGCKMGSTGPLTLYDCQMTAICADGTEIPHTCNAAVACAGHGGTSQSTYLMTFSVTGYTDKVQISSDGAMQTFRASSP